MKKFKACILFLFILPLLCKNIVVFAEPVKVSINANDTEIREVISAIAEVGGFNVIIDDSVGGKINLKITNVSVKDLMEYLARLKNLYYVFEENTLLVAKNDKNIKENKNVYVFPLKYAKADELRTLLMATTDAERLKADSSLNALVLVGSTKEANFIRDSITALDVKLPQVMVEAEVIAINKTAIKELGVNWDWGQEGVIKFGANRDGTSYQANINAMLANGQAKVLAKPRVITSSGKEAKILIGDKIPVTKELVTAGAISTSIEYVDAGIKLIYTPLVNEEGYITAKIKTEVSTPSLVTDLKAYRITAREAQTEVRVKDGDVITIGGLVGTEEMKNNNSIPILSKLPIIGNLFQNNTTRVSETEIMILLYARIMR